MKKLFFLLLLLHCPVFFSFAQNVDLSVFSIPDSLKENANAVVRLNNINIDVLSQRKMIIKTKRVVSVINQEGLKAIDAVEYYDKSTSIKEISLVVLDASGNEIKKIKRKDFKDVAAADDVTLFSDNRIVFYEYTPVSYPFTVIYYCEKETSNTAFIPQWYPFDSFFVSVEKSILNVNCLPSLGLKKKELFFEKYKIQKLIESDSKISYKAEHLLAQKYEDYTPFESIFPKLIIGLDFFHLEGVDGNASDWKTMGKWFGDEVLKGSLELSEEVKIKIRNLIGTEQDPVKKAKIIYDYIQGKTRYVSIQEGIGGWRPMPAKDVDRLGYGDCKALTNYTKALLEVVGVPSYYTRLYGGKKKKDVIEDFVSMQSNHVILAIPVNENYIWLECTSQDNPFGYQGCFTDDRNALVMKPNGGEIVRTKRYSEKENSQTIKGSYTLSKEGNLTGQISIVSSGVRYEDKFRLEKSAVQERNLFYKEQWSNLNDLKISQVSYLNNKDNITFAENVQISSASYCDFLSKEMVFAINVFNQNNSVPHKYRQRKNPFEIDRGFSDYDEIEVTLPQGYTVKSKPEMLEIRNKFGEYKIEIILQKSGKIMYKRNLIIYKGFYNESEYNEYRLFREQIAKNDNSKIIITSI
ncbi:DUF3857 domain-containing protein [Flavobacterium enshiense]|uniref:DUF3857 domain-containing protein n=1 Tax=Flavobacterium enshiense TaxID=1341165 RepID=UPI00345D2149